MSIAADNTQSWLDQHARSALIEVGQDLEWLRKLRKEALTAFEKIGLPGIRDEEWRYTNLRALKSNAYQISTPSTKNLTSELEQKLSPAANARLVFIDGHLSVQHSHVSALGDGVLFLSLADALTTQQDIVKAHLGNALDSNTENKSQHNLQRKSQHGFNALNTAFCQDGYVLHLPNNSVLNDVLEVIFISSDPLSREASREANQQPDQESAQNNYPVAHTRNLIVAETNTKCTIVERHIGIDGCVYLNNSVTEIIAGDNAHIDHYKVQQESSDAFHIGGVFIQQAANSHVKNHNIALSGLVIRNDVNVDLKGQGAHSEMNGLVIGTGRQHVDNHTQVNHAVPNCTSDEYYKTILDDHARSVFRGRIIVAQDAQLTNADQQNNNLLLSNNAEADTKPQLEIYADDVKCSHGATVGQLDPKSLFYLRSRGIDKHSATALLTFAFANEVINRIQVNSVKEELTELIAGQLLNS